MNSKVPTTPDLDHVLLNHAISRHYTNCKCVVQTLFPPNCRLCGGYFWHRSGYGRSLCASSLSVVTANPPSKSLHPSPSQPLPTSSNSDASLMKNAAETTRIITDQLPKITYFVSSCGALTSPLARRAETVEGIHRKLALHYYAGWKFIDVLIRKAEGAGDERGMIAVAAGCGESVDLHDLGLKKNSSIGIAATACATYNDLSIEVCFS